MHKVFFYHKCTRLNIKNRSYTRITNLPDAKREKDQSKCVCERGSV